jgi:hypothetical protein
MTAKIERFLQTPGCYFVAVGAGHLVGDQGIPSQLRRKNFTVEQLYSGAALTSELNRLDQSEEPIPTAPAQVEAPFQRIAVAG